MTVQVGIRRFYNTSFISVFLSLFFFSKRKDKISLFIFLKISMFHLLYFPS